MNYYMELFQIIIINIGYYLGLKRLNVLDFNIKDSVIFVLINSICTLLCSIYIVSDLRVYFSVIILFTILFVLTKFKFRKAFLSTIYLEVISICFEIVLVLAVLVLSNVLSFLDFDSFVNSIENNCFVSFVTNFLFALFISVFSGFGFVKKFYNTTLEYKLEKYSYKIVSAIIISLFLITFIYYFIFSYDVDLFIFVLFVVLIGLVLYVSGSNIRILLSYNDTKSKYDDSLENLAKYEEIIDKYRISNHENKNQLQMIRTLIKQKDKNVEKYIDDLVDTVYMENEKLFMSLSMLPSGIRATLYTKLVYMDNNNVEYKCNIDRNVRSNFDIDDNLALKVCNVISVFIDNSIDEVMEKKNGFVEIDVYYDSIDSTITFEISNLVSTKITGDIFKKGFTTKKQGHGYGLALAKNIIDSDPYLSNRFDIKDGVFTQYLSIKIKR